MSAAQMDIAMKALNLLMRLLEYGDADMTPPSSHTHGKAAENDQSPSRWKERQTAVGRAAEGMLAEMLAHVGFSKAEPFCHAPTGVREGAMKVVAALVDGHAENQAELAEVA